MKGGRTRHVIGTCNICNEPILSGDLLRVERRFKVHVWCKDRQMQRKAKVPPPAPAVPWPWMEGRTNEDAEKDWKEWVEQRQEWQDYLADVQRTNPGLDVRVIRREFLKMLVRSTGGEK